MAVHVQQVQCEREARAVFRLRYRIYVEELARMQRHANVGSRTVEEPLDRNARLFAAFEGKRLIGTVRTNYAWLGDLGYYEQLYEMQRIGPAHPRQTSVTTKLLVLPEARNKLVAVRLAVATYRQALKDGVLFDFIDVYPARIPFFERLGYRVHLPRAEHPEYGTVVVMYLSLCDRDHMQRVDSPLLRVLERVHEPGSDFLGLTPFPSATAGVTR
jgi:GNAT superfamily N-acetyltransferase